MRTPIIRASLEEILVRRGWLASEQVVGLLRRAGATRQPLRRLVLEDGLVSEDVLAQALAEQYGLRYEPLDDFQINPAVFRTISPDWMRLDAFVPVEAPEGTWTVAVADPHDLSLLDALSLLLDRDITLVVSTRSAILKALIQAEFHAALACGEGPWGAVLPGRERSEDRSPVATLAGTILAGAMRRHATDIHIEATAEAVEVKYRIGGILYPAMAPLGVHWHAPLVSRIEAGSTPANGQGRVADGESPLATERRFTLRLARRAVDFRVSVLTSALGETMVIRIPEEARS